MIIVFAKSFPYGFLWFYKLSQVLEWRVTGFFISRKGNVELPHSIVPMWLRRHYVIPTWKRCFTVFLLGRWISARKHSELKAFSSTLLPFQKKTIPAELRSLFRLGAKTCLSRLAEQIFSSKRIKRFL